MILQSNKEKLYSLIDQYLEKKIVAWLFCNEFHNFYDIGMGEETLTDLETMVFDKLSEAAGRFSDIEEDLKKYPGVYVTESELLQEVILAKKSLLNS